MMNERIHPLSPPIVPTTLPLSNTVTPALPRDISSNVITDGEEGDEADYTIKCICSFNDDDGNTVYCEPCDSWQHILCFYPHDPDAPNRDDFLHKCHECQPRQLDWPAAKRRQINARAKEQALREAEFTTDERDDGGKPTKKLPSKKSHKKRNPSELRLNGFDHEKSHKKASHQDSSNNTKKSKSHRTHGSISHVAKRSPSHNNGHPPSPATTPPDLPDNFRLHDHCTQLQDMYESDAAPLDINSFARVGLVSEMSSWATDNQKLRTVLGQEDVEGIIQSFKPGFNYSAYDWPKLKLRSEDVGSKEVPLHIKYISVVQPCHNQKLLGELKGLVGIQREFCADSDFFKRLSHPPPFVFFHEYLPLYIDTRTEGSLCRYLRRSCKPTCSIDTYVTNVSEYHFVVVNDDSVTPDDQLTVPWDIKFPTHVRGRYNSLLVPNQLDGDIKPAADATDEEFEYLSDYIRSLLTEFGGCACGLGNGCSFVKFHRNYHGKLQAQANGAKPKKVRKPKNQISPTSTGHATNSREVSEGGQDQVDAEEDTRSTSGSVRSKPQSRDMTPSAQVPELNGIAEPISEREKRKIEAAEKLFEQDQPPRKKKRPSDGPHANTITASQPAQKKTKTSTRPTVTAQTPQTNGNRQYKDASTSRQNSNANSPGTRPSPPAAVSPRSRLPSVAPSVTHSRQPSVARSARSIRSNYVDSGMQTDPSMDTDSWYSAPRVPLPKIKPCTLATRLMNARLKTNAARDARRAEEAQQVAASLQADAQTGSNDTVGSMSPVYARRPSTMSSHGTAEHSLIEEDITMRDVSPVASTKPDLPAWPEALPTPGLPASATSTRSSPELKMTMPPAPIFPNMSTGSVPPTPNGIGTPSSATASLTQSPFSSVHLPTAFSPQVLSSVGSQVPSPVKKKLSLSDYKARLKKPAVATPLGTESIIEEGKGGTLDGSNIVETPAADTTSAIDPLAAAGAKLAEGKSDTVMTGIGNDENIQPTVTP